jgi:hypothetical protein
MRHAKHQRATFRFLNHEEFAALSQPEQIDYLQRAVEAVKVTGLRETTHPDRSYPAQESQVANFAGMSN